LRAALRQYVTEAQLVEVGAASAWENDRDRFNYV